MLTLFRYEEIAAALREQIRLGKIIHGERMPAERILMQQYGVQRNTVRQALLLLQKEGWLDVRPRSGAFAISESGTETARYDALPKDVSQGTVLVINSWNQASTAVNRILSGLAQSFEGTGYALQRFNSLPRPGTRLHVLPSADYLKGNQVVGAILWAQSATDISRLSELRRSVPLILVDRRVSGFEADCVRFDDLAGGYLVTKHLISQGHRRIGFLGDEAFAETVQQRWRGYTLALEESSISPDSVCIRLFHGIHEGLFADYMSLFLAGAGDPLTAVVCSNDTTALTLLRFLRTAGYRVPDDIAVTGYGNLLSDYMDTLELTTVEQPFEEVGRSAGKLLLERLAPQPTFPIDISHQIELPVHLIARHSSSLRR